MSDMEELKKAYEILGLPEDATRDQVENRYLILMKKHRAQQIRVEAGETPEEQLDISEYSRAYKLILGIESEKGSTEPKQSKTSHFFYYYKVHLVVGVIVLLIAGYMIKESIDKRNEAARLGPANLEFSLYGNYYFADMEALETNLMKLVPEWNRIEMLNTYVPVEVKSQQDMALQQKSVLMLMTEHDDLYILDRRNFESLLNQGALLPLDGLPNWSFVQQKKEKILTGKAQAESVEDTAEHPYGIDITGNPAFAGIETGGEKLILAVRFADKRWDATNELMRKLIETTP